MDAQRRTSLAYGITRSLRVRPTIAARGRSTSSASVNTEETAVAPDAVADTLLTDVRTLDPRIVVDLRYATANNFTGAPLPGYLANRAFMRREAAAALAGWKPIFGRGALAQVFDAYRPVRATLAMVEWTRRVNRPDLLTDGYIASRSRHNLGLAIDLTLIDLATGKELEMGTPFDTFSRRLHRERVGARRRRTDRS